MTASARHLALEGCAIMVVEDEFFQAKDLACALSEAGARLVGPFPSVDDALEALQQDGAVDAAVLDINLRGRAVYEVADLLAERGIPFLFATGYDPDLVPSAHQARPICIKPFRFENLVAQMVALCADASGGGDQQAHKLV